MSNQAEDLVAAPKVYEEKVRGGLRGILFTAIGLLCMGVAFGFGFLQLWQSNNKLTLTINDMQAELQQADKQVSAMLQSVSELQGVAQQAQAAASRQEKMFAEWQNSQQDVTEIYLQLNFLSAQLDSLPLPVNPIPSDQNILTPNERLTTPSWWQSFMDKLLTALSKIVVVRYNHDHVQPLVMPEAKAFLYQNLHAQMENVMWAVLHRNNEIYHASLLRMSKWINTYFLLDNPQTQNVLKDLQRLQAMQLPSNHNVTPQNATENTQGAIIQNKTTAPTK